jgi:hypothetical protein
MAAAINEFRIRLRAALWWLVPLLVAAALVAWETNFGRELRLSAPPEEPVAPRPVVTSLLPEYAIAGGTASLSDTVQRTLFNPTRRPAPVLLTDSSKARLQRGQFALTGTMVIGGKNTAFLRETAGGKSRRVLQGDTVNGILVADVKPDRVRLALGDESEELVLRVVTNPRPTVQPAAPASAAAAATTAAPATAPPPVLPAPAGTAAAQPAGTADGSLAERRRAARAAQAAVQSQTSTPDGNPIPSPAPAAAPTTPPAAPAAAPPPGAAADPRWAEVYRAYQQPRTPNPTAPQR